MRRAILCNVSIITLTACACAAAVRAEEPRCTGELPAVQREVGDAPLSTEKETQVKALLDQVVRACREKNDVVAMAGIDQVRAVISTERNPPASSQ
jgi:hypothetical protein